MVLGERFEKWDEGTYITQFDDESAWVGILHATVDRGP